MRGRLTNRAALVVGEDPLAAAVSRAFAAEGAHLFESASDAPPSDAAQRCVARHGGLDAAFVPASVDWCRAVAPALAIRGGSLVAHVSVRSVAGDVRDHDDAARGGATAAVVRGIATEFGSAGVRANCVVSLPADADPDAYARHTLVDVPSADDVAAVVVFLASDDAAFITGQALHCDGGLVAHLPHLAALRDAGVATVALRSSPRGPVDPG